MHFQKYVRGDLFEFDDRNGCEMEMISGDEIQNVRTYQGRKHLSAFLYVCQLHILVVWQ